MKSKKKERERIALAYARIMNENLIGYCCIYFSYNNFGHLILLIHIFFYFHF
jgi:hypothetical protein